MKLHKSGLTGLVLGAALLGACEEKTEVVIPPDIDPIVLSLVPDECNLIVGQTCQLVAVVTGGDESTVRTATFTSSDPSVATVNQTTGLVTAVAPGQAQITARATADANAADVTNVNVTQDPANVPPEISIKSVTVGNTNTPVPINNVQGQIDITANLEIPEGGRISAVEWLVDNTVVCRQEFSGASGDLAAAAEEAQAAVELVCSVNTAAFDATTGAVTFPNGPHQITVRVIGTQGTVVAEAPPTQFSQLVFNNRNFISASVSSSRGTAQGGAGPRSLAPLGSLWHAGDLTFTLLSVNFGPVENTLANATVTITTSGLGVTGNVGCTSTNTLATDPTIAATDGGAGGLLTPSCPPASAARLVNAPATGGQFAVTFPENAAMSSNGVANVEDIFNPATGGIFIASVTSGGQAGPVCINPDPALNPIQLCGTGQPGGSQPGVVFFANPIRLDNLAPRITQLNIVRPNQYYNASFVPTHTAGSAACTAPCAATVDYGVDRQTDAGNATFQAGAAANALVDVTTGFTALPETQVSTTNLFQLTVQDALGNQRVRFATAVPTTVTTNAAAALLFGIDNTVPTLTVTSGPPDQSTNCPVAPSDPTSCAGVNQWVISFSDAGIGPSGFNVNPVSVKLEQILAAGITCRHPDTGAAVSCTTNSGFVADDGLITLPTPDGYYQFTVFVTDAAGNQSTQTVRLTLRDYVAPVAGGIASPATITGGGPVSFSSSLSDNVELGDLLPTYTFNAFPAGAEWSEPAVVIGEYGPTPIVNTSAGAVTVGNFVKSLEPTGGTHLPDGTVFPATGFAYVVRDVAGVRLNDACPPSGAADGSTTQNCILRRVDITAAVASANTFPAYTALNTLNAANAAHGLFTIQAPSAATVCTRVSGNCSPNTPKSTTLSVTLTGPAGTFADPFAGARVNFYWQDASLRWRYIGTATVSATDNTVLNTRTYTYSFVWTPAGLFPQGAVDYVAPIRAVGVNTSGSGLVSQQTTVTLDNS